VVLGVNPGERRIALGLKQALGDPWDEAAKRFSPGTIVEGTVRSLQKFGGFIELAEGIEGLVHISDLVADRRLNHPNEVLKVDQRVRAVVLEFDRDKRRIKLGMKQLEPDSSDEYISEHKVGDEVTGRVVRVENGSARVELGEGVMGICQASGQAQPAATGSFGAQLAAALKREAPAPAPPQSADAALTIGQVRSFRIAAIHPQEKKIDLILPAAI
jgi:small subunit ribosomal protein S1